MDAIEMLKGRRSVRNYKDEKVSRETMAEIMEATRYAQSWSNFQIARYTFVEDEAKIAQLADAGVNDFIYNIKTLKKASGVAVLSFVKGKSGKKDPDGNDYATNKESIWEMFDAGISCQTFCLAAFEKGVGTCVMGIIDDENIAKIVNLPADETVAALIVYGYPTEHKSAPPRKTVEELSRWA